MDIATILALVMKGVNVIQILAQAGQAIAPAVKVVTDLIKGAQTGTVTDAELTATEATLDKMIAEFNTPIV